MIKYAGELRLAIVHSSCLFLLCLYHRIIVLSRSYFYAQTIKIQILIKVIVVNEFLINQQQNP